MWPTLSAGTAQHAPRVKATGLWPLTQKLAGCVEAGEPAFYDQTMAILIDTPRWPAHGRLWAHLVSDDNLEELHEFARIHGVHPRSFDLDHYDVPEEIVDRLIAAGARPVTARELVTALRESGLRVRARDRR